MAGFADKHVSIVCQLSERSSRSNDCCCGMLTGRLWPDPDGHHPAPTGCFAPRSGRSDQKSEMRSRMTAYG